MRKYKRYKLFFLWSIAIFFMISFPALYAQGADSENAAPGTEYTEGDGDSNENRNDLPPEEDTETPQDAANPETRIDPDHKDSENEEAETLIPDVDVFTGAAVLKIPIQIPPGVNNLQPNLNLVYNSYRKDGWIGMGWNIGVGSISRSTKFGLDYSAYDFEANGNRIHVVNSGTPGPGGEYRAEIEQSYTKYFFEGQNGWVAQLRDGTKYYYGQKAASRLDDPLEPANVFKWCLDKVEDTHGNVITYTYLKDRSQIYLKEINYSENSVIFNLEPRKPDDIGLSYAEGFKVETAFRLKSIEVKNARHGLARAYELSYDNMGVLSKSYLNGIQEYGSDGGLLSGSKLPKKTISYTTVKNSKTGFSHVKTIPTPSNTERFHLGDFNGDGKTDFIASSKAADNPNFPGWKLYLSHGNDFIEESSNSTIGWDSKFYMGDFNGDGHSDFIATNTNGWGLYLSTTLSGKTNFVYKSNNNISFNASDRLHLGDFSGDGKTDILVVPTKKDANDQWLGWRLYQSTGESFTEVENNKYPNNGEIFHLGDFNGDGKMDFVVTANDKINSLWKGWKLYLSTGNNFKKISEGATLSYDEDIYVGDYNGDGKSDFISVSKKTNPGWKLHLSTGKKFLEGSESPLPSNDDELYPGDYNGDGKTDIIAVSKNHLLGYKLYQSTGNGLLEITGMTSPSSSEDIYVGDFNGDSKDEFLSVSKISNSGLHYYQSEVNESQGIESNTTDLLGTFDNGKGAKLTFNYESSSKYPNKKLPFIQKVVGSMEIVAENGFHSKTFYDYEGGLYDSETRDFWGFKKVKKTAADGTITEKVYNQGRYTKGLILEEVLKSGTPGNPKLKETVYSWGQTALTPPESQFVFLQSKKTIFDGNDNFYSLEKYKPYNSQCGFLEKKVVTGTDAAGNEVPTLVTKWTFENIIPHRDDWLWRLTDTTVYDGSVSPMKLLRKTQNHYYSINTADGTIGDLQFSDLYYSDTDYARTSYKYDSYGNIREITDAKGNLPSLFEYDLDTHTYLTKTTNPMGHITSSTWDYRYGKLETVTDENGNVSEFSYDPFGRVSTITHRDSGGSEVGYLERQYHDNETVSGKPNYILSRIKESAGSFVESWNYVDGLGRPIQSVSKGESQYVVNKLYYDNMGRLHYTAGPIHNGAPGFINWIVGDFEKPDHPLEKRVYDGLGRVTEIVSKDKQNGPVETTISYYGFTTETIDPDGNKKAEHRDHLGRITHIVEYLPESTTNPEIHTRYLYNAVGDLTDVRNHYWNATALDKDRYETTIEYDYMGRKTVMKDPDMGAWSYIYDKNSNLELQTDAEGQQIAFDYDALNRPKTKTYLNTKPGVVTQNVTYTYDNDVANTNGIGRLHKMITGPAATPDVTLTYNRYDPFGQVNSVTKNVIGDQDRTTGYDYDLAGRLSTITYPDNYSVNYSYYPGTSLFEKALGSDNVNYAQVTNYHPTGKMQRLVHGNGVETNYTYDVESTRITKIVTSRGAGIYMNRDYLYSPAGDIERLTDTDNVIYEYSYDSLHRLTSEISSKPLEVLPSVLGFKHDNVSGPLHAPSAVKVNANPGADYTYSYDKNGNQNSGPNLMNVTDVKDRSLTYNADNMPVKVESSGAHLAEFVYDGEGKRAKKQSGSKINIYISKYFEIVDGVITKYIFAGNLRVAVIKNGQVTYLHKDHLGSSTVTSDVNGNKQEVTAYLPFGLTRGAEKISATHYTFTDQEWDGATGLFNYDARLYDPMIGVFGSADSIIPDIYGPQSLNRYSYVLNNPLIYTDPTGHENSSDSDGGGTKEEIKEAEDHWNKHYGPPKPPKKFSLWGWFKKKISLDLSIKYTESWSTPDGPQFNSKQLDISIDGGIGTGGDGGGTSDGSPNTNNSSNDTSNYMLNGQVNSGTMSNSLKVGTNSYFYSNILSVDIIDKEKNNKKTISYEELLKMIKKKQSIGLTIAK